MMQISLRKNVARALVCAVLVGASLSLIGCKKKEKNTAIGAVLGAGAGAVIGGATGGGGGAAIGAGIGAVTGGVLGNVLTDDEAEEK